MPPCCPIADVEWRAAHWRAWRGGARLNPIATREARELDAVLRTLRLVIPAEGDALPRAFVDRVHAALKRQRRMRSSARVRRNVRLQRALV